MLAAVGPRHHLAGRQRIRLTDLAGDLWLVSVRGGLIERACLAAGFEPEIAYLTDDPTAINGIVAAILSLTSRRLGGQALTAPTSSPREIRRSSAMASAITGAIMIMISTDMYHH
jgi:hypothetical protein